ncbi:hypothetical protein PL321_15250 [Caloramator sp. mosi_1]|uniref:Kae1-like domain-containing protein n=1 Tax=Caloramator sp. mosi_1 TaxID=3023090 RepID=UPI00235EAE84|nr:hypothetical protein [Caloramator sp. mosi_1]WDC83825.1 hypothetical protein PL321_15250 [Caloramator sp. mosi_1]
MFDGVSAILGLKSIVSYEGQGAILIEKYADVNEESSYNYKLVNNNLIEFDWTPMINEILNDLENGEDKAKICAKFMNTLICFASTVTEQIRQETGCNVVVLSGGVFQNMYLLNKMKTKLNKMGFSVYTHKRVSTNDEGISLGQTAVVANGGGIKCV